MNKLKPVILGTYKLEYSSTIIVKKEDAEEIVSKIEKEGKHVETSPGLPMTEEEFLKSIPEEKRKKLSEKNLSASYVTIDLYDKIMNPPPDLK